MVDPEPDDDLLDELRDAVNDDPLAEAPASEVLSPDLDRYRIVRKLGEGGMGVVWEAEQKSPRRRVALKVTRPLTSGGTALDRFRLEAEVLGRLQHRGIARIFEAGTFEGVGGAQPFLAMEFVEGRPLDVATDHLDVPARVGVFLEICDAVQHAHQRGVIHRDLKPSNILVDDQGAARVLDFGIARVFEGDTDVSLRTQTGQLVGTLAYMSPEQLRGETGSIDTRTDIWSLGAVLFELLARRLPHDLEGLATAEAMRTLLETEPHPLGRIVPSCRGDLETIVAKAMEPDLERRYTSVAAMADDLRRFLRHEPITARPASRTYQLKKFVRRNRGLVTTASAVFVLLVGALVFVSFQVVRARDAEESEREAAEEANRRRLEAEQEARAEQAAREFLMAVIVRSAPRQRKDAGATFEDMLEEAAGRVAADLADYPEVRGDVHRTLGQAFDELGHYDRAEEHIEKARASYASLPEPVRLRKEFLVFARLSHVAMHRQDMAEAERLCREALELEPYLHERQRKRALALRSDYALTLATQGKNAEAVGIYRQVLAADLEINGGEHSPDGAVAMGNLAAALAGSGRGDEAEALWPKAIEAQRRHLGERSPMVADTIMMLGMHKAQTRRSPEALPLLEEALAIKQERLGKDHGRLARAHFNLAMVLLQLKRPQDALLHLETAYPLSKKLLGPAANDTIVMARRLATTLYRFKRQQDAADVLEGLLTELLEGDAADAAKRVGDQLIQLYGAWKRPELAEAVRKRLQP